MSYKPLLAELERRFEDWQYREGLTFQDLSKDVDALFSLLPGGCAEDSNVATALNDLYADADGATEESENYTVVDILEDVELFIDRLRLITAEEDEDPSEDSE